MQENQDPKAVYGDIINLPYTGTKRKKHISMVDRGAQFGAFKALTGHEEAIEETARITGTMAILDEYEIEKINNVLVEAVENPGKRLIITYFEKDLKKDGGAYITKKACIKKVTEPEKNLVLDDGTIIEIDTVVSVEYE